MATKVTWTSKVLGEMPLNGGSVLKVMVSKSSDGTMTLGLRKFVKRASGEESPTRDGFNIMYEKKGEYKKLARKLSTLLAEVGAAE